MREPNIKKNTTKNRTVNKKELWNEAYDAALITTGAIGASMVAKKVVETPLNTPETLKGAAKLVLAAGASSMLIKYGQEKK